MRNLTYAPPALVGVGTFATLTKGQTPFGLYDGYWGWFG